MNKKYATHKREPFFEIAKKLIKEDSRVLDVGAGNGDFTKYCKYDSMFLFEGNAENVKRLKSKYENVEHGSLPFLPYENNSFDLIHMSHVIEHLYPNDVYETLKEFDRCCKPGGAIVISAPLIWNGFYDDLSHIKPYNPGVFIRYLCSHDIGAYTREKISSEYKIEVLQYRYAEIPITLGISKSDNFKGKVFYKIYNFLRRKGLKQYQKTGYTVVLRKGLNT